MRSTKLLSAALMSLALASSAMAAPEAAPTTRPAPVRTDEPSIKTSGKDGKPDAKFMRLHEQFLARGKEGPIGVLFLGDSITEAWSTRGKEVWAKTYADMNPKPANFGIGGDRTEHVLWRIANGELDGIDPKVVVLMIGTNNIGTSPANILKGDEKIVAEIHQKLPHAKLLLLGIFPRGEGKTDFSLAAKEEKIKTVNAELAKLDDGKQTRYLDIGEKFLVDGKLTKEVMPDALHPNAKGYEIWADAMQPLLDEMMK